MLQICWYVWKMCLAGDMHSIETDEEQSGVLPNKCDQIQYGRMKAVWGCHQERWHWAQKLACYLGCGCCLIWMRMVDGRTSRNPWWLLEVVLSTVSRTVQCNTKERTGDAGRSSGKRVEGRWNVNEISGLHARPKELTVKRRRTLHNSQRASGCNR